MKKMTGLVFIGIFLIIIAAGCSAASTTVSPSPVVTQTNPVSLPGSAPSATPVPSSSPTTLPSPSPTTLLPPSPTTVLSSSPTAAPTATPTANPTSSPAPVQAASPTASPTSTPALTATPTITSTSSASTGTSTAASSGCLDKAAFSDDVTYPDGTLVEPGQHFTKTWKIHNEGTCDWHGYSLIYAGGDAMSGAMSTSMKDVKVNEYASISVDLVAPSRGGAVTGYWEFKNAAGQNFGVDSGGQGLIWVTVTVDYPTPAPTTTGGTSGSTGSGTGSATSGSCTYSLNNSYVSQLLTLINNARTQNGLKALTLSPKLTAAALAHSMDMACNNFISHNGSDGTTWYDRIKAQGYPNYTTGRENIYVGDPSFGGDAQGAFTWWMNSKIHHDNIMYPTVTEAGIAYVYDASATYGGYYTLDLARP